MLQGTTASQGAHGREHGWTKPKDARDQIFSASVCIFIVCVLGGVVEVECGEMPYKVSNFPSRRKGFRCWHPERKANALCIVFSCFLGVTL